MTGIILLILLQHITSSQTGIPEILSCVLVAAIHPSSLLCGIPLQNHTSISLSLPLMLGG
jgi:hypothetical protein